MTLRVAFFGAGQMARHHLAAIERAGRSVIVGVYDPMRGRAEEFAATAGTRAFDSMAALLADARPDVVHVCTPPATHFDAARAALEGGAHVYVEKPFALNAGDAQTLLGLARTRRLLACAGHQLLWDRAFETLMRHGASLGDIVQIDSHFTFRPVGQSALRAGPRALAALLQDILPHPLYTLIAALERFAPGETIDLTWTQSGASDLQASLRAGSSTGRLSVSLRGRPVASALTLVGTRGTLTCDFIRSAVVGAANPGTETLEKVLNPIVEGVQLATRSAAGVAQRLRSGAAYPGLAELIAAFHHAISTGGTPPLTDAHLTGVSAIFGTLSAQIEDAVRGAAARQARASTSASPLVVVTGARGYLGSEIVRALPHVRGISRGARPADGPHAAEWIAADLSVGLSPDALAGADVVVHAAAETSGSYDAHRRNSIDATRNLLRAMQAAGVTRLVLVSSLSTLRPPRTPWEVQDERTPRPRNPRPLGAYTWGKSRQEELVEREAAALGIATRIVRPGALVDREDPSLPGLLGRRLFGRWHLGLGRPGLPIAVCGVDRCARAIAWCATHFDTAPPVVNLFDPAVATRGTFIADLWERGWSGQVVWLPISLIAAGLITARTVLALLAGRWPDRLAAWSILRPRRFDGRLAAELLRAADPDATAIQFASIRRSTVSGSATADL
jgi:2-alkyl-3-oxoalkanoate reductase